MVPELLVLALEVQRSPIGFAHLGDPTRPLPDAFGDWLAASGAALAPARIQATADGLGTDPQTLSAAFRLLLRQTLLLPQADHYRVLGLSRTCSAQALKRHHGLLLRLLHPDRTPGAQARDVRLAARINAAYQVLRDPEARRAYDEGLVPLAGEEAIELFHRWGPPTGGAPVAGGPHWASRAGGPVLALILGLGLLAGVLLLLLQPPRGSALRLNPGLAARPGSGPAYLNDPGGVSADRPPEWPTPTPAAREGIAPTPGAAPSMIPQGLAQSDPPRAAETAIAPAQASAPEPRRTLAQAPPPAVPVAPKAAAQVTATVQPPALTQTQAQAPLPAAPVAPKAPSLAPPPAAAVVPKAQALPPGPSVASKAPPPAPPVAPKAPVRVAATVQPPNPTQTPAQVPTPVPPVASKAPAQAPTPAAPATPKAPPPAAAVVPKAPAQTPPVASKVPVQALPPAAPPAPSAARAATPPGPGSRGAPGAAPDPRRGSGGQLESQDRLIARLERAFSSGDLPGLVSLFTANAEVNGSRGAEAVRRAYQSAAAGAQRPRLRIIGLSWRRLGDQRLLGRGTMRRGHQAERGTNPGGHGGPLEIELVPWMGDYKISRLTYPFAPP